MKIIRIFIVLMIIPVLFWAESNKEFDQYFIDATMRVDYFHVGDANEEFATVDQIYQQGVWAGSWDNLLDTFNNGRYYIKIYELASGKLIYSKGFDSYFGEYKTTPWAEKRIKRTYHESALFPYPKNKIRFTLEVRDKKNILSPFFEREINPASVSIIKENPGLGIKTFEVQKNGSPKNKVDIAFIAEGYSSKETDKFESDINRFTEVLFKLEPYKSFKDRFNIYGVLKPSDESGVDEPQSGIFKNSSVNATLGEEVAEVEENSEKLSRENAAKMDAFLAKSRFINQVGAFEGAGYSSEGLFRPMLDCLMFSKGTKPFCRVCEKAVIRKIKFYSE